MYERIVDYQRRDQDENDQYASIRKARQQQPPISLQQQLAARRQRRRRDLDSQIMSLSAISELSPAHHNQQSETDAYRPPPAVPPASPINE